MLATRTGGAQSWPGSGRNWLKINLFPNQLISKHIEFVFVRIIFIYGA